MKPVRFHCSPLATAIRTMSAKPLDELEQVLAAGAPSSAASLALSVVDDGRHDCDPRPAHDEVGLSGAVGVANDTEST